MEYERLKEMPRFFVHYCLKFYDDNFKDQLLKIIDNSIIKNKNIIFYVEYEEEKTFSINIAFNDYLFCGFSCSDAINLLFPDEVIEKIELIYSKYKVNIKNASISLLCLDNILAERYYMETGIIGRAADIIHKLNCEIYFEVGKDGIWSYNALKNICLKICKIDIDLIRDYQEILKIVKNILKEKNKNKIENFSDIILLKYSMIYIRKLLKCNKIKK